MTEPKVNGYSSESAQRELSNEYQHDKVPMIFKDLCILVLWTKVASALEGLSATLAIPLLSNSTVFPVPRPTRPNLDTA